MLEPSRKSRQMQSCCNRAAIVFRRSSSRHALELHTETIDTLQDDLGRYVPEQNCDRSVLGHVDQHHLELDPSIQSHGGQAVLSIPDSVCSDYAQQISHNDSLDLAMVKQF